MKYELDLNDEQYQHLNEILEKAREDELNSIPDITDTNAFSGVSDITNIQDSLKIQHDERDRSGDINKILEQKFQEAFGREGTDDIDRLVQNPEFLQAFAQGIERLKQEPLEVSSPKGGAKERIQRNLEVLKRTTEKLAGRDDGGLEALIERSKAEQGLGLGEPIDLSGTELDEQMLEQEKAATVETPANRDQQPHPDIEFFQEIHEATEKHGDGDYGITDLELGEDYTLRSTYSGGRIFKFNDSFVEFESPYSERGGIGHPIVVTGQVKPELKEFILEQVQDLEKSQDRSSTELDHSIERLDPDEVDWRDLMAEQDPSRPPRPTTQEIADEFNLDIVESAEDGYGDPGFDLTRDEMFGEPGTFELARTALISKGVLQDGELHVHMGGGLMASINENLTGLEMYQSTGNSFEPVYFQKSEGELATLDKMSDSQLARVAAFSGLAQELEMVDATARDWQREVDSRLGISEAQPEPSSALEYPDYFDDSPDPDELNYHSSLVRETSEPVDRDSSGDNNTKFFKHVQSAAFDHGSMNRGEVISLELSDGYQIQTWEDSVIISKEINGRPTILYEQDRDTSKDLLTDEAKASITAGITKLDHRVLAENFGVDVDNEPDQEISIFDMVAQPPSSIDMESMDAVIARDTDGTAVEVITPGPERDANEAKRIAAQSKEPPSQYALDVVEHLKQNSEQDVPSATSSKSVLVADVLKEALGRDISTTQVEKPFKAVPDLEVTTGEATQKRHQANREFFDAMATATIEHTEPSKGAHQLKLGNDLTSTVINDQLIISRDDGKGNQDVVYGHSRGTAHLSGTGDGHIDKLTAQEKAGALQEVQSLGKSKQRTVSRASRARQDKSDSFDMDR